MGGYGVRGAIGGYFVDLLSQLSSKVSVQACKRYPRWGLRSTYRTYFFLAGA